MAHVKALLLLFLDDESSFHEARNRGVYRPRARMADKVKNPSSHFSKKLEKSEMAMAAAGAVWRVYLSDSGDQWLKLKPWSRSV